VDHAAIDMHAAYLQVDTTIRIALAECDTPPTTEVRNESHNLPYPEVVRTVELHDLSGQFMAQDARVREVRLSSLESVKVGATNTKAANSKQRFVIAGNRRFSRTVAQSAG